MASDPPWLPEVKAIFDAAGIPPEAWVPIMLHESGARPGAENDTRTQTEFNPGTQAEWSIGLFQINVHAKGLAPDAEAQLAAELKDPVTNAKYAAAMMAGPWAKIKDWVTVQAPVTWAAHLGIRSGWPGTFAEGTVLSPYVLRVMGEFENTATQWLSRVGDFSHGLIGPFWGQASGTGGGQSATNSVTTAPGYPPGGAGISSGLAGGQTTANASLSGGINLGQIVAGGVKAAENQASTDFRAWLASPAAKTLLFFILGGSLVMIALVALLFETNRKVADVALSIVPNPPRGTTGKGSKPLFDLQTDSPRTQRAEGTSLL